MISVVSWMCWSDCSHRVYSCPKGVIEQASAEVPSKAEIHNRLADGGKSALFICLRTLLATRFNGGNQDFCRNADLGRKTLHTDSCVSM
jgi:hypothetical protein